MKLVIIYTDGACSGNPGPGGWAAILRYKENEKEISGGETSTTNNRMELLAAIRALEELREPCEVHLHSDSKYVVNGMTEWIHGWKRHNWKNAQKKEVLNRELWELLDRLSGIHKVTWVWVKGHADSPLNNRCDELARREILRIQNN